ncbi:hypothetical protein SAMN05660649_02644 [Desulfotomaculum arcticum]|uniref:Uncharacterized protein n=1 Tax=Desulfotruncus arcticus DSM 17038 TaxID=1121424 RepID=A0A1I2UIV5_9FIRM|nr:hypothetical protein [Desulfotruncus arcticus]SFG76980.1 hypothetical protein SAMN05660649_02644 [Desulfotomaculum arcticum] [Desulfotruncus arcticus DSM 17038]
MEEILRTYSPWLLFGVLMRRGGCCGSHTGHNNNGDHDHTDVHQKDSSTTKKRSCH